MKINNRKIRKLIYNPKLFFKDFIKKRLHLADQHTLNNINDEGIAVPPDNHRNNVYRAKQYESIAKTINKFDYITQHNCLKVVLDTLTNEGFNFWIEDIDIPNTIRIGIKEEVKNSVLGYLSKADYGKYIIYIVKRNDYMYFFKIMDPERNIFIKSQEIEINFWRKNDNYIFTNNLNSNVKRIPIKYREKTIYSINLPWLRKDEFKNLYLSNRLDIVPSIASSYNFDIDIVYTWVNGNDPNWQQKKAAYTSHSMHSLDDNTVRYRDNQELRYSLRSVESFFKCYRKIFIISDHQKPEWIDDHPNIIFINHEDIIDSKYLPIYNSNAIECALHHIPGLSEYFIYLNDDFMFARPLSKDYFFYPNGIVKCFMATEGFYDRTDANEESCANAAHRNARMFAKKFGNTLYTRCAHVPQGYLKSILQDMEESFHDEYKITFANRFRSNTDFIPTAYSFNYWAIKNCKGVPINIGAERLVTNRGNKNILCEIEKIYNGKYNLFCINDAPTSPLIDAKVQEFFNTFYSTPASWEKNESWI